MNNRVKKIFFDDFSIVVIAELPVFDTQKVGQHSFQLFLYCYSSSESLDSSMTLNKHVVKTVKWVYIDFLIESVKNTDLTAAET